MNTLPRLALILLVVAPMALLAGCSNVGDTNPVTPDQMAEIRKKQEAERSGGTPPGADSRPPAGN